MSKNLKFDVEFTDPKRVYHDGGGRKKPRVERRMLPWKKGEEFSDVIYDKIYDNVLDARDKSVKKLNQNKKFDAKKFVDGFTKELNRRVVNKLPNIIKKSILSEIKDGMSPVKGKGKYEKYSESYKKKIRANKTAVKSKKVAPVNLRDEGDLVKSLKVKKK